MVQAKPDAPPAAPAAVVVGAHAQRCNDAMVRPCDSHLHHVLSCATCQRLLWLHFRDRDDEDNNPPRPRRSRRSVSGASVLNTRVSVTWGTLLLVLLAVSSVVLLLLRLGRRE